MLDLSRIDAGLALERDDVDVAAVLDGEVDRAAMLAPQITVRRTGLPSLTLQADPTRLSQIVSNLLDNARRYTPAGGAITVDLRAGDDVAEVTVTDTGPGIPEQERDRVFERLVRLTPGAPATTAAPGWDWRSRGRWPAPTAATWSACPTRAALSSGSSCRSTPGDRDS